MRTLSPWLYWTPRVLAILFALWLVIFSFDVFGTGLTFWQTVGAFLLHNVPSMVLGLVITFSWRKEILATIVFSILGGLYILQMVYNGFSNGFAFYMLSYSLIIAGPLFLLAWLYWKNWTQKKH